MSREVTYHRAVFINQSLRSSQGSAAVNKRSLDEARLELKRKEEEAGRESEKAAEHQRLLDDVSQLNLLRESNTALRNDNEKHQVKVKALSKQVRLSESQRMPPIQPLIRLAWLSAAFGGQRPRRASPEEDQGY